MACETGAQAGIEFMQIAEQGTRWLIRAIDLGFDAGEPGGATGEGSAGRDQGVAELSAGIAVIGQSRMSATVGPMLANSAWTVEITATLTMLVAPRRSQTWWWRDHEGQADGSP